MKISVQKEDLVKGIQTVQNAVSARASLPILANILFEAKNNQVVLTTTDLDIAISCVIPAEIEESGAIAIPAKRFGDVAKELFQDEPVRIKIDKGNTVRITSKKTYFKIPSLPKDDFPQIPKFKEDKDTIKVSQNTLKNMLKMTQFAMSRDEARYVLNGTLFVFEKNTLKLVATDGRRLAMISKPMDQSISKTINVIVPTKTIQELGRNLEDSGEVLMFLKDNQLQFRIGETFITSRLIEGEFPNYEQVIPQKTKEKLSLNTREFLSATKRASIFTNQESQSIKINLDKNRLVITKNTPEMGEAYEEIETSYNGGDFTIGFNPNYLIDALKNIDDESVNFELIDPEKPGVIKNGEDYTYIVLPMQLS